MKNKKTKRKYGKGLNLASTEEVLSVNWRRHNME